MFISYQLYIIVKKDISLKIGSLGVHTLKQGNYIYTGSAKRNIDSRISRHLLRQKNLHWHIDYLTTHPDVEVTNVVKSLIPECELNETIFGYTPIKGFGSSDCKRCVSHFKMVT